MSSAPGAMLGDLMRAAMAARGVDAAGLDMSPKCVAGCRTTVERDGGWCKVCAAAELLRTRRAMLAAATESLPDWPWCRVGDPEFEALRAKTPELFEPVLAWTIEGGSMVLLGGTGLGKTAVVRAKARRILDAGESGKLPEDKMRVAIGLRFVSVADIAKARRNHPFGQGDPPILRMAYESPLLILDELGREPQGDTSIFELIDARYRAKLTTFITSNMLKKDLPARYTESGSRRITSLGRVIEIAKVPS